MVKLKFLQLMIVPFIACGAGFISNAHSQTIVRVGETEVRLNQEQGILNGNYASFYSNGNRKVEGQFEHNKRVGEWKFYDEAGELLIVRNYKNPFCVIQELPAVETECGTDDFENREFKELDADDVMVIERFSRFLSVQENPILESVSLNTIKTSVHNSDIKLYNLNTNGYYIGGELESINYSRYEDAFFAGFLLQSEVFFDNSRYIFEERVISAIPVFEKPEGGYLYDFGLYYPEAREFFKAQKGDSKLFENLDEVLFMNGASSSLAITPENYVMQVNENMFAPTLDAEGLIERARFEARLIERKNDLLLRVLLESN